MSYDTLHALRGARFGVADSAWPPMVSYVWIVVDLFSTNPSLMHFFQVGVLFVSFGCLLNFFGIKSIIYRFFIFLGILLTPYLIGTLAVIWKDVLMASFIFLSFVLWVNYEKSKNKILLSLSFAFMLIAICSRHNAIFAAVPILIYYFYSFVNNSYPSIIYKKTLILFFSVFFLLISISFKSFIDTYSLTNSTEMKSSTNNFLKGRMITDLSGASVCLEKNLFEKIANNSTLDKIKSSYDPRHTNLSLGLYENVNKSELDDIKLQHLWFESALKHPICFFQYHFDLTRYLIGAHKGKQFLITHPSVDKNEFGYELKEFKARDIYVNYITNYCKYLLLKPVMLHIMFLFFILLAFIRKVPLHSSIFALSSSSYLYFLSFVFFGNAADARLLFYSNIMIYLLVAVLANILFFQKDLKKYA